MFSVLEQIGPQWSTEYEIGIPPVIGTRPQLGLSPNTPHQADGVRLVLVSADFDDQTPEIHRFLNSQGVHDTTYLKRETDQVFIDALNPKWTGTIPATFVYDASGRRVAFWEGRADRARFEAAIRHALEGAPSATKENRS